jgi:tRNA A37 threonylcarbamoyladenosine dehydratase
MADQYSRTRLLLGEDGLTKLRNARVAVFGLGGVGGYAAEALARAGIGKLVLVDSDCVSRSNINRQLCALESTVGRPKVEVIAERLRDINPNIKVVCRKEFFLPENAHLFDFSSYDYVIDAIDTYEPSVIARYILDVAGAYNRFYHNCSILGAESEQIRNTRLALTQAAKTVLGNAFGLICLAKTEKV